MNWVQRVWSLVKRPSSSPTSSGRVCQHASQEASRPGRGAFASLRSVGIGVVLLSATACGYNDVIDADEAVKASWGQVQNVYQRRADLIPNLVKTVKASAEFESSTLEKVIEARAKVGQMKIDASTIDDPDKLKQFEQAQGQLSSSLSRLLVVSEQYPQLRANQAFLALQDELAGTENRIAVERKRYVETIAEYNKVVLRFPTSIGASMRGMKERPSFNATPGSDKAPEVQF
jgi:LemA protein